MLITSASILNQENPLNIVFFSDENVSKGDIFEITYDEKVQYFEANQIEMSETGSLKVTANETGNWRSYLSAKKTFDIRHLKFYVVTKVTNPNTIVEIQKSKGYL